MRFNKTILVISAGAFLSLPAFSLPVLANEHHSGNAVGASDKKNDGRKLSMTVPGLGTAVVTVTPAQPKLPPFGKPFSSGHKIVLGQPAFDKFGKKDLAIETSGNNITVRVPPSIDAAIDDAQVVTRQLGKYASSGVAGASRVINMIVLYFKQWTGTTTITPGGYPYVEKSSTMHTIMPAPMPAPTTIASGHRLYFTGEGRLKSVVSR
jgi:hypothetical protein